MANTWKGRSFWISTVSVGTTDLDRAGFEALTYTKVGHAGLIGDIGAVSNIVGYDELDTETTQKGKGVTNAGDPQVEVARNESDAGQNLMRAAADTPFNYAFKSIAPDAPSATYNGTVKYMRGLVTSAINQGGRVEDNDLEIYNLALNQKPLTVKPEAMSVPVNTVRPSITGTAVQVGVTLTADEGVWTNGEGAGLTYAYQWQHDTSGNGTFTNVSVGGTSKTYVPVVGDIGDSLRVVVTASNAAGAGTPANSLGTIPIIAA